MWKIFSCFKSFIYQSSSQVLQCWQALSVWTLEIFIVIFVLHLSRSIRNSALKNGLASLKLKLSREGAVMTGSHVLSLNNVPDSGPSDLHLCRCGFKTAGPSGGRGRSVGVAAAWWRSTACTEPWSVTPSRCLSPSSNQPRMASQTLTLHGC